MGGSFKDAHSLGSSVESLHLEQRIEKDPCEGLLGGTEVGELYRLCSVGRAADRRSHLPDLKDP